MYTTEEILKMPTTYNGCGYYIVTSPQGEEFTIDVDVEDDYRPTHINNVKIED